MQHVANRLVHHHVAVVAGLGRAHAVATLAVFRALRTADAVVSHAHAADPASAVTAATPTTAAAGAGAGRVFAARYARRLAGRSCVAAVYCRACADATGRVLIGRSSVAGVAGAGRPLWIGLPAIARCRAAFTAVHAAIDAEVIFAVHVLFGCRNRRRRRSRRAARRQTWNIAGRRSVVLAEHTLRLANQVHGLNAEIGVRLIKAAHGGFIGSVPVRTVIPTRRVAGRPVVILVA